VTAFAAEGQIRRTTTTDADGRYEFADLPAGRFSVSVTKTGYVTLQYGQRRTFEAGTPITLADDQRIDRIDFSLPRGAVISVRITDDFGDPLAGAQVQVQRYQYGPDGQRSTDAGLGRWQLRLQFH
jgi:protocatechuate 3,4-dioxygenase beta subunit